MRFEIKTETENIMEKENTINENCPACGQAQDLTQMSAEQIQSLQQMTSIAGVMEQVFNFLELVSRVKAPYMTKLCVINRETGESADGMPQVSLWAGIGDMTPIGRLEVKNAEIVELKKRIEELEAKKD